MSEQWTRAMRRALALAVTPGVPLGPNPRVGCVLVSDDGGVVGEGYHRGAGSAHAEVDAIADARARGNSGLIKGATAVVTLEPCRHTGATGPCTQALLEAGIGRVVFALADPNPVAAGGADLLGSAGVEVVTGVCAGEAASANKAWLHGIRTGRPLVTWKYAATADGLSAAKDGSSQWISSAPARLDAHRLRGQSDVLMVGTGTVLRDNPRLTVRDQDDLEVAQQPKVAIVGSRPIPSSAKLLTTPERVMVLNRHQPTEALEELFTRGFRHVFLEGGPTLAAAFLRSGLIDEVVAYVAPMFLGAGTAAVADLGIASLSQADRMQLVDCHVVGEGADACAKLTMVPAVEKSKEAEVPRKGSA